MISTRRREFAIFNPLLFVSDPLHITTQHHTTQYLTTQHHKRNITQRNIISHIITHNIISHITTQSTTSNPTTQHHITTSQRVTTSFGHWALEVAFYFSEDWKFRTNSVWLTRHLFFSIDQTKTVLTLGRGGGQVVSVLAFYSDDPLKGTIFL